MPISAARKIAFDVLRRVESGGAYASDLLHARLTEDVRREDAALATELTLGVLRRRRLLDFLLERQVQKPLASLDLEVLVALRLGLYQLRFLARVPPRAAVNESVELVKQARKHSAAPLVNAVLRRISTEPNQPHDELVPHNLPLAERLGILHSHPTWMVERWLERYGEARTIALLEANNRAPNLACAIHNLARRDDAIRALEDAGLRVEPGKLLSSALIARGGNPTRTKAFSSGWISIQDEASQVIPLLLEAKPDQSVLDLCAAPGGKTATLALAAGEKALVVAGDRYGHRLRALGAQLKRIGVQHVRPMALDATVPLPLRRQFDRILVDAPCSGTGTLARNPEIRWRLRPEDLAEFHERQVTMLLHALEHLAPGGRLVYSTCSLEPEENEGVIEHVLRGNQSVHALTSEEPAKPLLPHLAEGVETARLFDKQGFFRTFPPEQHTDGFFAAILEVPDRSR
jgi:16S rRNA (cytosine967-C5)-methyltransferase